MSSELYSYHKDKVGWTFFLMFKYLKGERFQPVIDAMKGATTDSEKASARLANEHHGSKK